VAPSPELVTLFPATLLDPRFTVPLTVFLSVLTWLTPASKALSTMLMACEASNLSTIGPLLSTDKVS
jgi:hypothetical protein